MPGTTNFPTALDAFPDITETSQENDPAIYHDVVHANVHAAVAAMQTKLGIDGSTDEASVDFRLAAAESDLDAAAIAIGGLVSDMAGKAAAVHAHEIDDVDGLSAALAEKQPAIQFEDEGDAQGDAGGVVTVNFTGAGVTASHAGGVLTVAIPGGGGGGSGVVEAIIAGSGITVDDTDPANPVVSATGGGGGGAAIDEGTYASLPGAPGEDDLYLVTDAPVVMRRGAAAWSVFGPVWRLRPPVDADFSWVNQGGASISAFGPLLHLSAPGNGASSHSLRGRFMSAPATPWTLRCLVSPLMRDAELMHFIGVAFRESSSGKLHAVMLGRYNNLPKIFVSKFADHTTPAGDYLEEHGYQRGPLWFELQDDGTNRIVSISQDGYHFLPLHTVGRTDYLTANEVGFFANPYSGSVPAGVTIHDWHFV